MNWLDRLLGKRAAPARKAAAPSELPSANSQFPATGAGRSSKLPPASSASTRRELLRVVLRDTLRRHGVPGEWVAAETLGVTSRTGEAGLYWRLRIRHWDARLPNYCVALQNALISRVHMFDPMAETWLRGISWEFALADESGCPTLPHPGWWTAMPREPEPVAAAPVAEGGDVIAGPVKIESASADVKADLDRLMAALDAQYQSADPAKVSYASTEPARL